MTPLRFANPSPPSGWVEDFHLQAVDHARHTRNGPSVGDAEAIRGCALGRLRHDSDVGSQSAAAINFCVSYGEWSL
jgi:hypothetical protein